MKKWIVNKPDQQAVDALCTQGGLTGLCAGVLVSRGIDTLEKAKRFFNQDRDGEILSSPFLIKDMREAVDIILDAVDMGRRICIYGDYDCDGITATALLYSYLECIGGNVTYYINKRAEGFGICEEAIKKLADDGVELIVTVDNGIQAVKEAELAAELGIELVITDHHKPGEILPEAAAVVDPHREDDSSPFKDFCGCGIAFKLIAALDSGESCFKSDSESDEDGDGGNGVNYTTALEQFSDIAAIATIGDVVPLNGENREIVRQGLHYLENTENLGLQALISVSGVKTPVSAVSAAFGIVPRINAAGRYDLCQEAVELLTCDDPDRAEELARQINGINEHRKNEGAKILEEIHRYISANPEILYERVLYIYGEGWYHGIIGIVASNLCERFGKPVFILSGENDEFARGSARAPEGFPVHKALAACSDILVKLGGHPGAGGFTVRRDRIREFGEALQKYAAEEFPAMPDSGIRADKVILPEELTVENVSSLSILEPCGEGNPSPVFVIPNAKITEIVPLSGGTHTRLILQYGSTSVTGLLFGTKTAEFPFKNGELLNILGFPELNTYGGRTSVNVRISDYRKSGMNQSKYFAAKDTYERFKRGEQIQKELLPRILPVRSEFEAVYRAVQKNGSVTFDSAFEAVYSESMNYCKFRIILDVFTELGLLKTDIFSEAVQLVPAAGKVNLESSEILSGLKKAVNSEMAGSPS